MQEMSCRICGCIEHVQLLDGVPCFGPGSERFSIWRCKRCSHCRTEPLLSNDGLGKYYEKFGPHQAADVGESQLARMGEIRESTLRGRVYRLIFSFRGAPFAEFFGRTGRLLDVGCGDGRFLVRMKELGWTVEGQDFIPAAGRVAENHGIKVAIGDLPDIATKEREGSYDVVCGWHVLEHVVEPKPFIAAAFRLLKPGGELVIEVPHVNALERHWFKQKWWLWMAPIHVQHFSKGSMRELFESCGFEHVEIRSFASHARHTLRDWPKFLSTPVQSIFRLLGWSTGRGSVIRGRAFKPQGKRTASDGTPK